MPTPRSIILTLFSSRTCSLCTTAKDTLLKAQQKIPFELKVLDIHRNECPKDLADQYMFDIPVIHLGDEFLAKHRIEEDKLLKAIKTYKDTGKVEKIQND
ncbi:thioredoxin-like protein [Halteromyces radiatus]|uniref:thioredoxin-like protein n=1 Tax=Halteromyces radiatus TaxID=101107 RepID=UPI0022211CDF|nr:thioredoxin-like protein [Halteromyces radiatus]KAI8084435.1 thioredoxin-like protein [Halteromyces radiatus]